MSNILKPVKSYLHTASTVPYTGMTLCDALDQSAENSPDKDAFAFVSKSDTKRITFKQFHHDVIKMAAGLLHLGLKPGDRVGLWFDNRYEWIVTQYAVAYMKMTYVRFLPGYSKEYMEYLVKNTKLTALVIGSGKQKDIAKQLFGVDRIIHLGNGEKSGMHHRFTDVFSLGSEDDTRRVKEIRKTVQQDDEVSIVFSSGSTGMPKAIVISHRCIMENMDTLVRQVKELIASDIRYLCVSPFPHRGSDIGTVGGVIRKFTVIVPDQNADSSLIAELIQRERVTFTFLMFHHLFDLVNQLKVRHGYDFSSLEYLATGGNMVPEEALDRARHQVTRNIFNNYGVTEGGWNTLNTNPNKLGSIGYPIDHQEVKIIDDKGNIVPLGTKGELCLRSPYVFLRYERDEDKTREVMDESGWYHTGDICLMDEAGCLEVIGRKKDIIIKGGLNIYPMEIERILIQHPKVKLPQVVSVPDERMVEEICACIQLEDDQETTADEIMDFLRPHIREYFLPKYFLFFPSFPSSPTGKIQRKEIAEKAIEKLGLSL